MSVQTLTCDRKVSRNEAKAQRALLRHKDLRSALRFIANSEGFELSEHLINRAEGLLAGQPHMPTAQATVHQLKRALFEAEATL